MSTKKIREALEWMKSECGEPRVRGALAELETIERAAQVLVAEDVPSMVYAVRDRAAADTSFTDNTWKHPRVTAFAEAAEVMAFIAKESNK